MDSKSDVLLGIAFIKLERCLSFELLDIQPVATYEDV
jgi:hypothetical protein